MGFLFWRRIPVLPLPPPPSVFRCLTQLAQVSHTHTAHVRLRPLLPQFEHRCRFAWQARNVLDGYKGRFACEAQRLVGTGGTRGGAGSASGTSAETVRIFVAGGRRGS